MANQPTRIAPAFHVGLMAVLIANACFFAWHATPHPLILIAAGAAAGVVAGILRRMSIQSSPSRFSGVQSGRFGAFSTNTPGRLSIAVLCITVVGFAAVAIIWGKGAGFGAAAGFASFFGVRDLLALSMLRESVGVQIAG